MGGGDHETAPTAARDPKQLGGPSARFFALESTRAKFADVLAFLEDNNGSAIEHEGLNAAKLAEVTASLIRFQEEHLGAKKVAEEQPMVVRIPAKLFLDFTSGGALCVMLGQYYTFKQRNNLRKLNLASPSQLDKHIELMFAITEALVECGKLVRPTIYFSSAIDAQLKGYLAGIAVNHQCTIVGSREEATYVVLPPIQTDVTEEYLRPVAMADSHMLVHWWYFPDSYDTWLTAAQAAEVTDAPDPEAANEETWEVHAQWISDMAAFNEVMNTEDYLVEDDAKTLTTEQFIALADARKASAPTHAAASPVKTDSGAGKKRKRDSPSDSSPASAQAGRSVLARKRVAVNGPPTLDMPLPDKEPRVSQIYDDEATSLNSKRRYIDANLKPPRKAQIQEIVADDSDNEDGEGAAVEAKWSVEEQQFKIIVPTAAAWFDYTTLDECEIKALPEFFSGVNQSKAPEIYMAYRNFMVDTYRLNPTEYLTATACRRNLVGDVCCILRIHAFLEQWGLINYQVDHEMRPSPMGPPSASHFMVLADTPDGLVPFNPRAEQDAAMEPADRVARATKTEDGAGARNFGLNTDLYSKPEHTGIDDTDWTDQETLALLEGIDMYQDDWIKVAEHVNETVHDSEPLRSHDDCIAGFVRLPIEDPYLDPDNSVGNDKSEGFPFANTANPLMTTLQFLLQTHKHGIKLPASVAGAGAQGALEQLSTDKTETPARRRSTIAAERRASMDTSEDGDAAADAPVAASDVSTLEQEGVRRVTEAVMTSAAEKAKLVARAEERKLKGLVSLLVEAQLEKIEIKLRHFQHIESMLDSEWSKLADEREKVMQDRIRVQQSWAQLKAQQSM